VEGVLQGKQCLTRPIVAGYQHGGAFDKAAAQQLVQATDAGFYEFKGNCRSPRHDLSNIF
jgi:hypothetical protein